MNSLFIFVLIGLSNSESDHSNPLQSLGSKDYKLLDEWEDHLTNLSAENLIVFEVSPLTSFELFESIETAPSEISGSWFTSNAESKNLEFIILDPTSQEVFRRIDTIEEVFSIETNLPGTYTIAFKNSQVITPIVVTFVMNSWRVNQELVKTEHLTPLESKVNEVNKKIKDFQLDSQFAGLRQTTHYRTVATANSNVFWFSLVESFLVFTATAWQIYYIQKLLDSRRVL